MTSKIGLKMKPVAFDQKVFALWNQIIPVQFPILISSQCHRFGLKINTRSKLNSKSMY